MCTGLRCGETPHSRSKARALTLSKSQQGNLEPCDPCDKKISAPDYSFAPERHAGRLRDSSPDFVARSGESIASMGLLFRYSPDSMELRWPEHDAVARSALCGSAGNRMGRTGGLSRGRSINSASSLVFHGWTVRRQISECIRFHDVAYTIQDRPAAECDRMFYNAMRCSGVSALEAKTMYYALLRFGWHWNFSIKRAKPVKIGRKMVARAQPGSSETVAAQQEIQGARTWISSSDPSIGQIEQRAAEGRP